MGFSTEQIVVDSTADLLAEPVLTVMGNGQELYTRLNVIVRLPSAASGPVYLGDSLVDTSSGFQLEPGDGVEVTLNKGDALYGVVASGSQTVHVIKQS